WQLTYRVRPPTTIVDGGTMEMRESRLDHVARFGGITFVVLGVAGFVTAGDAGLDDGAKIASYFADHRGRTPIGFHLAGIGLLAFVLWSWWIMKALQRTSDTRDNLGVGVFVAGAMTATVEFGVIALAMTLATISKQPVDPLLARALANAYQEFSYV